ncbi:MAG: dTMP kinase [Verrucomicrobiaceae bacterium]|nr:MAG: dTMP kinase [Verrucomicrobiaceae bacterium]
MKRGFTIAFEGIDGSGKTTHSKALASILRDRCHEVLVEHEPTQGPWGTKLRESGSTGRLSPEDELEYFLKDRRQHVDEVILPALAEGKIVILDRYYFSNMAYQGVRGLDINEIRRANEAFAPKPDLLFILDLDVDTALSRIGARGDVANEFEKKDSLERCREIFLSLAGEDFVRIIPTNSSKETVASMIQNAVDEKLMPRS